MSWLVLFVTLVTTPYIPPPTPTQSGTPPLVRCWQLDDVKCCYEWHGDLNMTGWRFLQCVK